ncbi:MAG TPA: hypothetical protein H9909_01765 [Candidatus Mediterraneibacter norfolkensis]|nr:hypothetical protein [Candidatus Mediterraneibacter norfolkensis]
MEKTKLGIPFGLLAAGIYFGVLFGGYLVAVLLAAYVLLVEDDEWLRRSSVKAVILLIVFSLIDIILGFFPDVLGVLSGIIGMFATPFTYYAFSNILSLIGEVFDIIKYLLFIALGLKALKMRSIIIPVVDKIIYKYMG